MKVNYSKILSCYSAALLILAAFTLNVLETDIGRIVTIALVVSAVFCMLSAIVVVFVQAFRNPAEKPEPNNLKNTDMEKKKQSFVAIDFEYLIQGRHDTPCQVGLVKVVNNVVVLRYATLIYVPESIGGELAYGNGITREMVADAPTLVEIGRALDASSQANRALRDRLNQPINANINKYGRGGLIDEVATGLEKEKKSGRNDAVRRLFG